MGIGSTAWPLMTDRKPKIDGKPNPTETPQTIDQTYEQVHLADFPEKLPVDPANGSFGLTTQGVYRYDRDRWAPIGYGAEDAAVPAIHARRMTVGETPRGRPLISNGSQTIHVDPENGSEDASGSVEDPVRTVQEAVGRAPIYLRDQFIVDLTTAPSLPVAYDEDVLVPAIIGTGQAGHEDEAPEAGPIQNLVIQGVGGEPEMAKIGSVMFGNVVGTTAGALYHATITRDSPYDDESFGLCAYGTGEVHISNVEITSGATNGITAYGSKMKATNVGIGERNVDVGVRGKRHASIVTRDFSGTAKGPAYLGVSNSQLTVKKGRRADGSPQFETRIGGLIYDTGTGEWNGLGNTAGTPNGSGETTGSTTNVPRVQDHPSDPSVGAVWYVDGTGEREEGFYGQGSDGPRRIDRGP